MIEQEYLELSNQLQVSFNEKEKEVEEIRQKNDDLKKELLTAYGMIRVIDYYVSATDIDEQIKASIDLLRGFLSDKYDELIS